MCWWRPAITRAQTPKRLPGRCFRGPTGPMPADWVGEFERRGITVSIGLGHDDAIEVFRAFGESDAVVYNARGASEQPAVD